MRLQPPKTRRKNFTPKEFEDYIKAHIVIGDSVTMSVTEFFDGLVQSLGEKEAMSRFLGMWPREYQARIFLVFRDHMLEKDLIK